MKLSVPIFLALILLLVTVSFVRAEAVEAAVGESAPATNIVPAYLTSTITTTNVVTPVDLAGVIVSSPEITLPEALPVTLYAFQPGAEAMLLVLTSTTAAQADGTFAFENVANPVGSMFITSATYAGVPYHSTPSMGEPMTITVFEATTATNHLMADQLHLIFGFSETGDLQVMEVYILTNVGNQTIVADPSGQFIMGLPLPEGAQTPEFRTGLVGEAELDTTDGFWETPAIRPGGMYGISVVFTLPYAGKITLDQPIELPVSSVGALLPEAGNLKIESEDLVDSGLSDFGDVSYHVYTGEALQAGDQLALTITGDPNLPASASVKGSSRSWLGLIIGLGAFGLALIVAGVWISRRNRLAAAGNKTEMVEDEGSDLDEAETGAPVDAETLMDDIIALDDLYQAGELPEAAYHERRAELKEKLRDIVADDAR